MYSRQAEPLLHSLLAECQEAERVARQQMKDPTRLPVAKKAKEAVECFRILETMVPKLLKRLQGENARARKAEREFAPRSAAEQADSVPEIHKLACSLRGSFGCVGAHSGRFETRRVSKRLCGKTSEKDSVSEVDVETMVKCKGGTACSVYRSIESALGASQPEGWEALTDATFHQQLISKGGHHPNSSWNLLNQFSGQALPSNWQDFHSERGVAVHSNTCPRYGKDCVFAGGWDPDTDAARVSCRGGRACMRAYIKHNQPLLELQAAG